MPNKETKQSGAEQSRGKHSREDQSREERNRAEQSGTERKGAEHAWMSHVVAFVYHFARQTFNLNHSSAFVKNVPIGAFRSALPLQVREGEIWVTT